MSEENIALPVTAPSSLDIRNFLFEDEDKESEKVEKPEPEKKEPEPTDPSPKEEEEQKPELDKADDEEKPLNIPLDKHPRFNRVISENKRMAEEVAQLRKMIEEGKTIKEVPQAPVVESVPREFQTLFGEDVEAYKAWKTMFEATADQRAKAILEETQRKERELREAQEAREAKNVSHILGELEELETKTGIQLSDPKNTVRNQILDLCEQYNLLTKEGMPNIQAAYDLHTKLYPTESTELAQKKKVVTKTVNKTNSQAKESEVLTPKKLKELERQGGLAHIWSQYK